MSDLHAVLAAALSRRASLFDALAAEGTDCFRLLHGATEGAPGLTVDRYGSVLLVQTGREPLQTSPEQLAEVVERETGWGLTPVWNHRPAFRREGFEAHHPVAELGPRTAREGGLTVQVDPRHGGLDPLLFLDLRAGRRAVRERARGGEVLNLFSYTCGVGLAAAAGGARRVDNVDFARSALSVGVTNAALNGLTGPWHRFVHEDFFPAVRQLAGLPVKGRRARTRTYLRLAPRQFDVVVLDPPRWAKTPFGAVDVVRDYPSLLKPSLLCVRPGGWILATNHVPAVTLEDFQRVLERTVEKNGRAVESLEVIVPDEDFPSPDGRPPLKMLLARLR